MGELETNPTDPTILSLSLTCTLPFVLCARYTKHPAEYWPKSHCLWEYDAFGKPWDPSVFCHWYRDRSMPRVSWPQHALARVRTACAPLDGTS